VRPVDCIRHDAPNHPMAVDDHVTHVAHSITAFAHYQAVGLDNVQVPIVQQWERFVQQLVHLLRLGRRIVADRDYTGLELVARRLCQLAELVPAATSEVPHIDHEHMCLAVSWTEGIALSVGIAQREAWGGVSHSQGGDTRS